jgi:hypothetical protein
VVGAGEVKVVASYVGVPQGAQGAALPSGPAVSSQCVKQCGVVQGSEDGQQFADDRLSLSWCILRRLYFRFSILHTFKNPSLLHFPLQCTFFLSCHSYMWGQGWGRAGTGDSFLTYRSASERFTEIVARSVSWLGLTPCNAVATVPLQQIKKKPQNGVSKGSFTCLSATGGPEGLHCQGEFGGEIGKAGNYTSKIHFDP